MRKRRTGKEAERNKQKQKRMGKQILKKDELEDGGRRADMEERTRRGQNKRRKGKERMKERREENTVERARQTRQTDRQRKVNTSSKPVWVKGIKGVQEQTDR